LKLTYYILILLLVQCFNLQAQLATADDPEVVSAEKAKEQGEYYKAIEVYDRLILRFPNDPEMVFQKAMCYYRMDEFPTAIRMGEELVNQNPLNPKFYRMLGNAYDLNGDYFTGIEILELGNSNILNEGAMFLDMGIIEMIREDYPKALDYWERGIASAPYFPDNYYWAAKIYAKSDEKVWALVYAEYFLNIEKNSDRFKEMSELMYQLYIDILYKDGGTVSIPLNRVANNSFLNGFNEICAEMKTEGNFAINVDRPRKTPAYLKGISHMRKRFAQKWAVKFGTQLKVPLFQRHLEMIDQNIFDAYNHWLMINGDPDYFMVWQRLNTGKYQKFLTWFIRNSMQIDIEHYFVRGQFEN